MKMQTVDLKYRERHNVSISLWDSESLGVFALYAGAATIHADVTAQQARDLAAAFAKLADALEAQTEAA